jgi:hypothetical protein
MKRRTPSLRQQRAIRDPGVASLIGRRQFVRTTGGILVAAAVGGCRDSGAPGSGVIRVTIVGLQAGFTTAGSATITGSGIATPVTIELPAVSSGEATVAVGTYHVVYAPPAGYTMAPGSSNEVDVTVIEGDTAGVVFSVVQADGTLRLTVAGVDAGAPNAGTAQVLRTDIGGQVPFGVVVPLSGAADSSVLPGAYTVTYTPPTGHQLVAGQTNPRGISVQSNAVTTVAFNVELPPPPPPGDIVFHSDFSTALGTSDAAVLDTSKAVPWGIRSAGIMEVISSAGLDFPTANVLRISSANGSGGLIRRTGLPVPAVGGSLWYRWYIRQTHADNLEDNETHPIQDGQAAGNCNWLFHVMHNHGGTGKWGPQFRAGSGNVFQNTYWWGPILDKGVTYRFELQIHRVGTGTYQMHVRVFNSADAMILSDVNFTNSNEGGNLTLANNPTINFNNVANLDGLNGGCNGIAGTNPPSFIYGYQSGFAVSTAGWIGAYAGGI